MIAQEYALFVARYERIISQTDQLLGSLCFNLLQAEEEQEFSGVVLTLENQRDTYNTYGRFLATTLDPVSGKLNTKDATVCFLCANKLNETAKKLRKQARKGGQEL